MACTLTLLATKKSQVRLGHCSFSMSRNQSKLMARTRREAKLEDRASRRYRKP